MLLLRVGPDAPGTLMFMRSRREVIVYVSVVVVVDKGGGARDSNET